jgi:hypothetical protein
MKYKITFSKHWLERKQKRFKIYSDEFILDDCQNNFEKKKFRISHSYCVKVNWKIAKYIVNDNYEIVTILHP